MDASASGITTLVILLGLGPLVWSLIALVKRLGLTWQQGVAPSAGAEGNGRSVPPNAQEQGSLEEREEVGGVEYILSQLGYQIGIGNLWRFPFMVGRWGGGAFVCAYVICLFLVAMPLYLLELILGQYTRKNTLGCFRMVHPRWLGIAYGQVWMLLTALSYYNVLIGYCCVYIVGSLREPLPWNDNGQQGALSAEDFWQREVLNKYTGGLEGQGLGPLQWKLVVALLAVWIMVFLSLAFGKQALAKVTWVTVVGPVVLLVVMLVRTSQLKGAGDGIAFYLGKFDASMLLNAKMWAAACGQILFSLSPGCGTAITLSSYTRPRTDVFRTCIGVSLANSIFSLMGGFAIFGILGNLAHTTGRTVAQVASSSGTGLAFVAIAQGIRTFGAGANTMAVLFFVMLLSLGLDTTFAWGETAVSYVQDWPLLSRWRPRRSVVVAVICAVLFLCGLPYCTRMGAELLDVLDHYCTSYYLLLGCCLEAVMFIFDFGWGRLRQALKEATVGNTATPNGRWISPYWRVCLVMVVPLATAALFVRTLAADIMRPYMGYPVFLQAIGWTSFAICTSLPISTCLSRGQSALPPFSKDKDCTAAANPGLAQGVANI